MVAMSCTGQLKRKQFNSQSVKRKTRNHRSTKGLRSLDENFDDDFKYFLSLVNDSNEKMQLLQEVHGDEDEDDEDEDDMDPHYSMFFKALIEDDLSYKLKVSENDGVPVFLKYEAQDNLDEEGNWLTRRKTSIGKRGEKIEAAKHLRDNQTKEKVEHSINLRSLQGKERKTLLTKRCSRQKHTLKCNNNFATRDTSEWDTCYQLFLDSFEKGESSGVFVYNGEEVNYEEKLESSSDSEIVVWDDAPYFSKGHDNPFVTSKPNGSFRKKVMKILKRPYNQDEYESLLKDVKELKPVGRTLDLRGRAVSSSVDGSCKSYLDYHRDLKKKIDAARHEQHKVLNILRGFFYWLEHVPNEGEGVFKPWLDASCLAVLPAPR